MKIVEIITNENIGLT